MDLTSVYNNISEGSRHKRKRVGRGTGSGTGKTAGRGHKGQNSRTGGGVRLGFEGGQTPLFRRIKKRGFNNFNRVEYQVINLEKLEALEITNVTISKMLEHKLITKTSMPVKILGNGKLTKKIRIEAHQFSKNAKEAIEANGGEIIVLASKNENSEIVEE